MSHDSFFNSVETSAKRKRERISDNRLNDPSYKDSYADTLIDYVDTLKEGETLYKPPWAKLTRRLSRLLLQRAALNPVITTRPAKTFRLATR